MARTSAALKSIHANIDSLSPAATTALAAFLETVVESAAAEDIADLEPATRSRRAAKPAAKAAAKPARGRRAAVEADEDEDETPAPRRKRRAAAEEDEAPAKPTRRRKAAAAEPAAPVRRARKPKAERLTDESPTVDDLYEFLEEFEANEDDLPEGGIREHKATLTEYGVADFSNFEGSTAEKREQMAGEVLALQTLEARLMQHDDDELEELAEDLDAEEAKSKKGNVRAIIVALSAEREEDEDDDADEDDGDDELEEDADEDDADEDEDEAPAPRRKARGASTAKAVVKRAAAKPVRKTRAAKGDDLSDLDDIEDIE